MKLLEIKLKINNNYIYFVNQGGSQEEAFQYMISNKGINKESVYKYEGIDTNGCRYKKQANAFSINSFTRIQSGNEDALTSAIANVGPIAAAVDSRQPSFKNYGPNSGVYSDPNCSYQLKDLDHAVTIVGFGTTSNGKDYYIIKNSWGTSWGMNGYMLLARNANNMCGIKNSFDHF